MDPRGFENSYISLSKDVDEAKSVHPNLSLEDARKIGNVLAWGDFVTILIDFLIIAFFVFFTDKIFEPFTFKQRCYCCYRRNKKRLTFLRDSHSLAQPCNISMRTFCLPNISKHPPVSIIWRHP